MTLPRLAYAALVDYQRDDTANIIEFFPTAREAWDHLSQHLEEEWGDAADHNEARITAEQAIAKADHHGEGRFHTLTPDWEGEPENDPQIEWRVMLLPLEPTMGMVNAARQRYADCAYPDHIVIQLAAQAEMSMHVWLLSRGAA